MKTKVYMGAALAGALLFAAGHLTATGGSGLSQKTKENLSTAMRGEAFAYAKYKLYAKHAEQNGDAELAELFTTAANIERFQHFAEEAQLAGVVGSDAANLKDAIKGESYEVETMYRQFAEPLESHGLALVQPGSSRVLVSGLGRKSRPEGMELLRMEHIRR